MADQIIQVPADSTGKKVDVEELTVGANTVQRQRITIAGTVAAAIAAVLNAQPAGTEYGLVVREAQKGQQAMAASRPVVIASDQSAFSVNIGTFPANQPFNLNQLAGTALAAPFDVDSGVGTQNVVGVSLRKSASGGSVEFGTATDPLRVDLTGTTTQPVSGTVTANAGTGTFSIQATAALPASVRLSDGAAFYDAAKTGQLPTTLVGGRLDINIGAFGAQPQASHTRNAAFAAAFAVGGELDDTAPVAATEGNVSPTRITAQRAFHVNLRNDGGTEVGTAGAPVRIDPTGSTAQPVVGAAADGVAVSGNPVRIAGKDGGGLTQDILTNASGNLQVDVLTLPANTAFNLNQIAGTAIVTGGIAGTQGIGGNIAHGSADSTSNPVKVGLKTIAHGANPTAVAAASRTDWYANRHGIPWVLGGHPNIVSLRANYTAAQTDIAIVTIGAGLKIVVTQLSVLASNANSVNVSALIGFGAVTTPTTTGVILAHPNIAAGSGVIRGDGSGILGVGADGEDLRITSSVPTGGSIDVVVSYFTVES